MAQGAADACFSVDASRFAYATECNYTVHSAGSAARDQPVHEAAALPTRDLSQLRSDRIKQLEEMTKLVGSNANELHVVACDVADCLVEVSGAQKHTERRRVVGNAGSRCIKQQQTPSHLQTSSRAQALELLVGSAACPVLATQRLGGASAPLRIAPTPAVLDRLPSRGFSLGETNLHLMDGKGEQLAEVARPIPGTTLDSLIGAPVCYLVALSLLSGSSMLSWTQFDVEALPVPQEADEQVKYFGAARSTWAVVSTDGTQTWLPPLYILSAMACMRALQQRRHKSGPAVSMRWTRLMVHVLGRRGDFESITQDFFYQKPDYFFAQWSLVHHLRGTDANLWINLLDSAAIRVQQNSTEKLDHTTALMARLRIECDIVYPPRRIGRDARVLEADDDHASVGTKRSSSSNNVSVMSERTSEHETASLGKRRKAALARPVSSLRVQRAPGAERPVSPGVARRPEATDDAPSSAPLPANDAADLLLMLTDGTPSPAPLPTNDAAGLLPMLPDGAPSPAPLPTNAGLLPMLTDDAPNPGDAAGLPTEIDWEETVLQLTGELPGGLVMHDDFFPFQVAGYLGDLP